MATKDQILKGKAAKNWIKIIGKHGDPLRTSILNPVIAHIANAFVLKPVKYEKLHPHPWVQEALDFAYLERTTAHNQSASEPYDPLLDWHSDTTRIASKLTELTKLKIWDLGCGEGYLGRWLSTLGVAYVGVEPSDDLIKYAREKKTTNEKYFQGTITDFLEKDAKSQVKPNLIVIVTVLDSVSSPDETLVCLAKFLQKKFWVDIPVFVVNLDPDYFVNEVPHQEENVGTVNFETGPQPVCSKVPSKWERIFADCGFFVVDQRPLHISLLEEELGIQILKRNKSEIYPNPDLILSHSPRQGPFYFWILRVRKTFSSKRINQQKRETEGLTSTTFSEEVHFPKDQLIEMKGNLGSFMYEVLDGEIIYNRQENVTFSFPQNSIFGQLEASSNYYSSRIFGSICTSKISTLIRTPLNVLREISPKSTLIFTLFESLVEHFDSINYLSFLNFSSKNLCSLVWKSALQNKQESINLAAFILNKCSITTADKNKNNNSYTLIECTHEEIIKTFYHGQKQTISANKRAVVLRPLSLFIKYNIVDNFSAHNIMAFDKTASQDSIVELEENLSSSTSFHLGLICAEIIQKFLQVDPPDDFDLKRYAMSISAYLKHPEDTQFFDDEIRKLTTPLNTEQILKFIIEDIKGLAIDDENEKLKVVQSFLESVYGHFCFSPGGQSSDFKREISSIFVVRDLWALLSCVLDDPDLWTTEFKKRTFSNSLERARKVSFFSQAISHLAQKAGVLSHKTVNNNN